LLAKMITSHSMCNPPR